MTKAKYIAPHAELLTLHFETPLLENSGNYRKSIPIEKKEESENVNDVSTANRLRWEDYDDEEW